MIEKIEHAALTHVGMERSENQDSYGVSQQDGLEFYFVCDGMGGHAGGSTASTLAVEVITSYLEERDEEPAERLGQAITRANHEIFEKQIYERELRGMGTTVVAVAIEFESALAWFCHVGDSRAYLLRGDVLSRVSRDHTMVQQLVDDGVITSAEADVHPNSNVISRSLGGQPEVEVEHGVEPLALEDGDIVMLCSDGLSGLVNELVIAQTMSELPTEEAAQRLVELANEAGGHDNITVEVILIGDKPEPRSDFSIELPPPAPGSRKYREMNDSESDYTPTPAPVAIGPGKGGDTVALDFSAGAFDERDERSEAREERARDSGQMPAANVRAETRDLASVEGPGSLRKTLVAVAALLGVVFVAMLVMYALQGDESQASPSQNAATSGQAS